MEILKILWENKGKIGGSLGALTVSIFFISEKINYVEKNTLAIVDFKHEAVIAQLKHISDQQDQIRKTLEKIDHRVYELNRKTLTSSFYEKEETKKEL